MAFPPEFKDPDSTIIRGIDWAKQLNEGDTITASSWFADPDPGLTVVDGGFIGTITQVTVSGGTVGQTLKATNEITTSAGETLQLSLTFIIAEL